MNKLNLIVMGKTGAGKSTLINSILGEDLAPTGIGQAVTKENQVYTKQLLFPFVNDACSNGEYGLVGRILNLYDTVGLEIDSSITKRTLREIKGYIKKAQEQESENDITLVWFCVNWKSSRFENYEVELIRSLSIDHEIPFVLVLTQCFSDELGDLEKQIKSDFPEIPIARILAKDYKLRSGTVPAYGIENLLQKSVLDYNNSKVRILESKLKVLTDDRKRRIAEMRSEGAKCVESYANKAAKIGFIPVACIPAVHGICVAMIVALNKIVGINSNEELASDIFVNAVVGLVATPFMAVPLLSAGVAYGYVSTIGETYLDALMLVVERSTDEELRNNSLMASRIKAEIKKRKN